MFIFNNGKYAPIELSKWLYNILTINNMVNMIEKDTLEIKNDKLVADINEMILINEKLYTNKR